MTDTDKEFGKLLEFCKKKKYQVINKNLKGEFGEIDFNSKTITLCTSLNKEKRIFFLLHELGHLLINKDRKFGEEKAFGVLNFSKKSLTNKISEIEEEYEAWHRGYKLAKKLQITLDRRKFEQTKAIALATYFHWAIKGNTKKL
jgi:hypothetical protein